MRIEELSLLDEVEVVVSNRVYVHIFYIFCDGRKLNRSDQWGRGQWKKPGRKPQILSGIDVGRVDMAVSYEGENQHRS